MHAVYTAAGPLLANVAEIRQTRRPYSNYVMVEIHDLHATGNVHVELHATQRFAVPAVQIG
jgi:hypothetical protein